MLTINRGNVVIFYYVQVPHVDYCLFQHGAFSVCLEVLCMGVILWILTRKRIC